MCYLSILLHLLYTSPGTIATHVILHSNHISLQLSYVTWHLVILSYVTSCLVMLSYFTSCLFMVFYVKLCLVMLSYITSCLIMLSFVLSCCFICPISLVPLGHWPCMIPGPVAYNVSPQKMQLPKTCVSFGEECIFRCCIMSCHAILC